MLPTIDEAAIEGFKFTECVPKNLALEMLQHRMSDVAGLKELLPQPIVRVALANPDQ